MKFTRFAAIAVAGATALALTACGANKDALSSGSGGSSSGAVVVGSADFPESQLIATIYANALKAKNIDATEKLNIGSREVYVPALKDGSIDLIPEYSGTLLQYLDKDTTATTGTEVSAALIKALPAGLTALTPSAAEDKDTVAVTQATADKYSLKTISDLQSHASDFVLGGPPEWKTRQSGIVGLKSVYGLNFKDFQSLDAGGPLTLNALTSGQIQAANIFSTDPALKASKLVALDDNKNLFLAQNITPIINGKKASDDVKRVLDAVSAALTTDDLISMNKRVADLDDMGDIANDWLKSKNLK